MLFVFEDRPSDSPFVERIWRTRSERAGAFTSVAVCQWEMVVTRHNGAATLTVRGPETRATPALIPQDAEFLGITFKLGALLPHLPPRHLVDGAVTLPDAARCSFWLGGAMWPCPDYDNAETFVARLARDGLLLFDPVVQAALHGRPRERSVRSVQRRFVHATGLTQSAIWQIERARRAAALLTGGVPILDTVDQAGYFDQPHLTRELRRLIGQTPAQILRSGESAYLALA